MRVVLGTNILVSALIVPAGIPAAISSAWEQGKFTLLSCLEHLDELHATLQKPKVANLEEEDEADSAHYGSVTSSCQSSPGELPVLFPAMTP